MRIWPQMDTTLPESSLSVNSYSIPHNIELEMGRSIQNMYIPHGPLRLGQIGNITHHHLSGVVHEHFKSAAFIAHAHILNGELNMSVFN